MDKVTYLRSVKKAERVFAYVQITERRKVATRVSKNRAAQLARQLEATDDIDAMWASEEQHFLLVG